MWDFYKTYQGSLTSRGEGQGGVGIALYQERLMRHIH